MLVVGEKINILNPLVHKAIQDEDFTTLVDLGIRQLNAGADALDINLGPGRAAGKLLPSLVQAIQEKKECTLFFTADVIGLTEGLKVHKGRPVINAVTAEHDSLTRAMAAAECFDASIVVLLVKNGVLPQSPDQWCLLAEEVLETAEKRHFPLENLYLDPVLRPQMNALTLDVISTGAGLSSLVEAVKLIKHLRTQGVKTIVGLSNVSLAMPYGSRSAMHCSVLNLLRSADLDAAILNPLDSKLMESLSKPLGPLCQPVKEFQELVCFLQTS